MLYHKHATEDGRNCTRGALRSSTDETAAEGTRFVSKCIYCQSNTPDVDRKPLKLTELPEGPWRKVSVDFCGPLGNGDLALVFHCQYCGYSVVEFVGSTSEKSTIPIFRRVFDAYRVPEVVKSANDPCAHPSTAIDLKNTN